MLEEDMDADNAEIYGIGFRWGCHYGNSHALNIPGYRVKTYFATGNAYVRSRFLVNVYIGKEWIMQEILFSQPKETEHYVPISPTVFHSLFTSKELFKFRDYWTEKNDWGSIVEFEEIEGRILFKFKVSNWKKKVWGINLDVIDHTFAGGLLRKFGPVMIYACIYPDTIKTLDDAASLWSAIRGISNINWKRNGHYEEEVERLRGEMTYHLNEIDGYGQQLESVCNKSAEALNTLADKYGIVVTL
jgi:hypothetical protein